VRQVQGTATGPSALTTKGDLATFDTAVARLAVGNNGETLIADSSTSTGLRYQADYAAGKNKIINGDFRVWQRGTSITPATGYGFTADRWRTYSWGSSTSTVTQQTFTPGTAPVAGYEGQYFLRVNSTNTNTFIGQQIEDVRTLAGQTVTVSFWAKAASAISGTANIAFDQNFGSGGSSTVNTSFSAGTSFTTSWARYSYTGTLPSVSGKTIGSSSFIDLTISLGVVNNNFDIWGVQVEAGSVATAFQTATGTIQGELAACQRYYFRLTQSAANEPLANYGNAISSTGIEHIITFPVYMRVSPTTVDFANLAAGDGVNARSNMSATTINAASLQFASVASTSSSLTQFRNYTILNQTSTTAHIGFSAEL
jgi:hypothetical protein